METESKPKYSSCSPDRDVTTNCVRDLDIIIDHNEKTSEDDINNERDNSKSIKNDLFCFFFLTFFF